MVGNATTATNRTTRAEKRSHLSFSAVSTFQACPLKYYFKYIVGLPEEIVSASLVFGSSIHAALQFHFEQLLAGNPAPDLDTLLDVFQQSWKEQADREIRFPKSEDVNSMGRLADRVLGAFQADLFAHPGGTIIGVEEELRGEVIPGLPDFLARVDLIVEQEDALVVTDFKTARSAWSQEHVKDAAGQLHLYHELSRPLRNGKAIQLQFAVMTKTKSPALNIHQILDDPQEIERTKRIVENVWNAIQAGSFYPNPSPLNCPTCPFRSSCRAWTG